MTVVALVRHGQTNWNLEGRLQGRSDVPLNETGRAQAQATGIEIASLPHRWATLVSSPLERAYDTAAAIGEHIHLPVSATYDDLVERGFGEAEGMVDYHAWRRWPGGRYPGMEAHHLLAGRMTDRLNILAAEHPDSGVIVVSHGGAIRAALGPMLGGPPPRIRNGGICLIEHSALGWEVLTINSVPPEDLWW